MSYSSSVPTIQPTAAPNPLQILSGWQDLANKQAQNAQIKASTANTEQSTATSQQALGEAKQKRAAQVLYGLSNLPDSELGSAAQQSLQDELKSGTIGQDEYNAHMNQVQQVLQKSNGNGASLRPYINGMLATTMAGPQAAQFLTGTPVDVDNGSQFSGGIRGGIGSSAPGAVMSTGPSYTKLPGPANIDVGNEILPTSGGRPVAPGLDKGFGPSFQNLEGGLGTFKNGQQVGNTVPYSLSPGQATQLQPRTVQNPDGSYTVVEKQLQQWNPALAPAGSKSGPGGPLGTGSYPQPPTTSMPLGTTGQLDKDQALFQKDKEALPTLVTGTQSLNKALGALNAVATGSGTEGLAKMRSYATSLGNVVGIDTKGVNTQDMNRAELEKYLTDYARQSGTAGRSDAGLEAAFKSNASGSINNAAAQDVVRTNIGRDRQRIAATMSSPNPQGSGHSSYVNDYMTKTDPRGFAWDTYTPQQQQSMLDQAKGTEGKANPNYQKLARAIGEAAKLKLLQQQAFTQQNVNAQPPLPGPVTNPLQNPPNVNQLQGGNNGQ